MPAKLFVETLLFFVNFAIQRMFIFHGRESEGGARGNGTPGRFYAWLILAVLAVLAAVEVYGFRTGHLFAQEIWAPEGRARLLQFGALYAALPRRC